jgi:asparagine synthase (glutamine-hydrolysing)
LRSSRRLAAAIDNPAAKAETMSGIAGIIRFDGGPVERDLIEKMTATMLYRGPDGINHWVRGSVALGQCMLRTTPESLEETQPLTNEDESLVLVMDGWLSNSEELRAELLAKSASQRTRADAELVLRAYEVWGEKCLAHLDGDFAFVIWDARRREAFCARDRVGNKPFNYHWDGKTFIFASELHSILATPGVPENFNDGMVAEFLADEWVSRDETFWKGIMRLCSAHQMVVNQSGRHIEEYWCPDLWNSLPYTKEEEFVRHYSDLLIETVRRMSRAHAPLACEVSGGLDSSALFAVADDLMRRGRFPAPNLQSYTLAFDDDSDANELSYCRAVEQHVGRPIREIAPSRMSLDWYREQARHYRDFPMYPNSTMGLGIRAAAKACDSRVLMVGVGGDQWLRGSLTYYADALAAFNWSEIVACVKKDSRNVGLATSLWWMFRHGFYPLLPDVVRRGIRRTLTRDRRQGIDTRAWLSPPLKAALRERVEKNRNLSVPKMKWVSQREHMLTLSSPFTMHALEFEERMASSVGIELRRPFFCREMVQFTFSTPEKWRRRGRIDKYLHRTALHGLLPENVRLRQDNAEFSITYVWYLSQLQELFADKLIGRYSAWVDTDYFSRLVLPLSAKTTGERAVSLRMIWSLFGCAAADTPKGSIE